MACYFTVLWPLKLCSKIFLTRSHRICSNFATTETTIREPSSLKQFLKKSPGTEKCKGKYLKSSYLSLIYLKPIWGGGGGLNRDWELIWEGELFNLKMTMVSVLHKVQEGWTSCSRGSESNPNFQLVNKPSRISPHGVLQSWLINRVYHLLVKNN